MCIRDRHSTIGLVITTDGSISYIPRDEYEEAEERVISELKATNRPYIVLLNCVYPNTCLLYTSIRRSRLRRRRRSPRRNRRPPRTPVRGPAIRRPARSRRTEAAYAAGTDGHGAQGHRRLLLRAGRGRPASVPCARKIPEGAHLALCGRPRALHGG